MALDVRHQEGASGTAAQLAEKRLRQILMITEAFQYQDASSTIFERVLDSIQIVLGYSSCSIHLLEPRGKYVYLAASRGIPDTIPASVMQTVKVEDLSHSYMRPLSNGKPYRPEEYRSGQEMPETVLVKGILKGEIIKIPLVSKEKLIGSLTIVNDDNGANEWFDTEQQWLEVIGCQLGTLIEQMDTYRQFQNVAILQERERVSQELHDNLSQFVGTMRLLAERIVDDLRRDDLSRIEEDAESLETISRDAYASIREEMMGLRYIQDPNQEIVTTIQDYVERFQRQWNIETVFKILNFDDGSSIEPRRGIQLFRIIQESLTNARRHAQATQVVVTLEMKDDILIARVNDNGVGFDTQGIPDIKLGLRIMRERACDIGGIVRVVSTLGIGTTVIIEVPLGSIGWTEGEP